MHMTRSPASLPGAATGEALDLSLTGSQLTVSQRPCGTSPAKHFTRSVSVAGEGLGPGGSRSIKNLRRSNSTTQVNQRGNLSISEDKTEDFLALFDSSSDGRKKLAGLSRASPDRTTWNILDDQPRTFPAPSSTRSAGSLDSPTGLRTREAGVPLAPNFTANNRLVESCWEGGVTKHQSLWSQSEEKSIDVYGGPLEMCIVISSPVHLGGWICVCMFFGDLPLWTCPLLLHRFIQQVNHAAITIQRWYRRHRQRRRAGEAALRRLLAAKKKVGETRGSVVMLTCSKSRETHLKISDSVVMKSDVLIGAGLAGLGTALPTRLDGRNTTASVPCALLQEIQRTASVEDQQQAPSSSRAQSKTTLNDLLDTLKLLEEEPERLSEPKSCRKDKYAWIDEDRDATSLTADNLERHGQLSQASALPDGGALLSEAKLQSIMSFLDEMEKSEQERPRSVTSGSHREVTSSMMRMKLELEEKRRTVSMLQTALAQQRELTVRHVKDTEKELNRTFQLQKEQYEATIQRHLAFIDQLIDDKKALSERCEGVVGELKQVDQKYTKKIAQMQEQHELEIKKLKELMSATEKIRREKWINEKTKKIKEITVKGLEPEIQKLISKHKQELARLKVLHEAELQQADERAVQRYMQQSEELRQQLERERDEHTLRERELARQRYTHLQEEEQALQQQRRRLYKEVAEEKERLAQLAARQRAELDDLRRRLEDNSSVAGRALREEMEKHREEQERRHQAEMKALKERLEIEKQAWEENYMKKEEAWLLSRERELKEEVRRVRDKEIELAIQRLEEETTGAREECERAAENRVKRVRDKYEAELRELERSERGTQEKYRELKKKQNETENEVIRLQALLRQKEQEVQDITQVRDKLLEERRSMAEVIRQEFAERLVETEEENRRMKVEVSELRARLRLEVERVAREKEEELAEVHQR
uniref:Centrosomal protein 131 n=1 Tax=Scleropages formosus TaxID=113540 RepID=A0A8C9U7A1_SCLFO